MSGADAGDSVSNDPTYPAHRVADVVLRDGSTVRIRPVVPSDELGIRAFLGGLSVESRAFRFFSAGANLDRAAAQAVDVDYHDRYALVATFGPDHRIVGHAIAIRLGSPEEGARGKLPRPASTAAVVPASAEAAFAVADEFQGRGLGTILLEHLGEASREAGIAIFVNQVLPENHRMIDVFRASGFPVRTRSMPGYLEIEVPTSLTPEGLERFHDRERIAATAALAAFLRPASVAVVGASQDPDEIGGRILRNLVRTGFNGSIYPVNPATRAVESIPAFASISDVPGPVDLAVLAVPAGQVQNIARVCGERGVRSLVVISAGFAETGPDGAERQRRLLSICREHGMRLIGPNCMGLINTDPSVRLNATFAPADPPHGSLGFLSQSGGLGLAAIERAAALGLGLSSFVSVGNKADISGNDVIQYWEQDDQTAVILLYLESFGNPRNFGRIARRVARTKPIVAVKGGRSTAGVRATGSHTGALIAASDLTVDALFRQAGVIRTDTLSELFDVAAVLAGQSIPRGSRVGIVTNAGGAGILCADACEAESLTVPPLSDRTRTTLRTCLDASASVDNPVDVVASGHAGAFARALEAMADGGDVDALIAICVPALPGVTDEVATAIRSFADSSTPDAVNHRHGAGAGNQGDVEHHIPILAVFMGTSGVPGPLRLSVAHRVPPATAGAGPAPSVGPDSTRSVVPTFAFPEQAARALAAVVRYGRWRERPEGTVLDPAGVDADAAAAIIAEALRRGGSWLTAAEVDGLLQCYGLAGPPSQVVRSPRAAGIVAEELGGSVAVKAIAPGLVHRTDAGGVILGLSGRAEAERAAKAVRASIARSGHAAEGFLVQRMVEDAVEMIVGVVHDALFGPVVAVGAGGTAAELLGDAQVRLTPITDLDASEMLRSLRTFPLLDGYRGGPKVDLAALEEVILRVAALVDAHREVAELDLNPVMATPNGALVVDARVRVEPTGPPPPLLARRRA